MANVLILIAAQQQGFLSAVAKLLSKEHRVAIATSEGVRDNIERSWPEMAKLVSVRSDFVPDIERDSIIEQCLAREEKYGETFSMISSYDRAVGKGYLFNADRHPDIIRSWWPHERKLRHLFDDFLYYEHLMDMHAPDLVVAGFPGKIPTLVARNHDATTLSISTARFGEKYMWVENEYLENSHMTESLKQNLARVTDDGEFSDIDYVQLTESKVAHARIDYSYGSAFKFAMRRTLKEAQGRVRTAASGVIRRKKLPPRMGYRFLGWVPSRLRRPYIYRYIAKHGVTPAELEGRRIVYVPLHLEPEVALLSVSPEFNNSMEMIAWVSKSVPADTVLVVKEQPFSYGIRSRHFYDNLRRIGNVFLAHPSTHPWEWIRAAALVATITGTAGIEAVYFERPVLSFGRHQIINDLPTVRFANSYESTRPGVDELLQLGESGDRTFKIAKEALYRTHMDTTFDLPGYADTYGDSRPQLELAEVAIEQLCLQYPGVLEGRGVKGEADSQARDPLRSPA